MNYEIYVIMVNPAWFTFGEKQKHVTNEQDIFCYGMVNIGRIKK